MALRNFESSGMFINVSTGRFRWRVGSKEDKAAHLPETYKDCQMIDGRLMGLKSFQGEYNGQPTLNVECLMEDGAERYRIQFKMDAWYAHGFFQRILAVDVRRPFTLGVME